MLNVKLKKRNKEQIKSGGGRQEECKNNSKLWIVNVCEYVNNSKFKI